MHPNEEIARRGYRAFGEGDMATLDEIMSDDAVWHSGGNNRFTGTYEGKEATFAFFGELMAASGGTFSNELHDVLANDDHVVALVQSTANAGGKTLDDRSVHIMHVDADGKLTEFWAFTENQQAFDDFWG